ncbi:MAG TPA: hypothetical protein VHX11_11050 [Acidobacteriaceae bacterium]|nr:hypothetical protein [Acidobacteriaceae bacterium]
MSIVKALQLGEGAHQAFVPSLPVSCAVLCVDCECITVSFHDGCPICGGRSLLNVAQILGTLSADRVRPVPSLDSIDSELDVARCA